MEAVRDWSTAERRTVHKDSSNSTPTSAFLSLRLHALKMPWISRSFADFTEDRNRVEVEASCIFFIPSSSPTSLALISANSARDTSLPSGFLRITRPAALRDWTLVAVRDWLHASSPSAWATAETGALQTVASHNTHQPYAKRSGQRLWPYRNGWNSRSARCQRLARDSQIPFPR